MIARLSILIIASILVSCSQGTAPKMSDNTLICTIPEQDEKVNHLIQDAELYLDINDTDTLVSESKQKIWKQDYQKKLFSPWNKKYRFVKASITWPWSVYKYPKGFGLNFKPYNIEWYENLKTQANLSGYPSKSLLAISVTKTHLRNYPTNLPLFYDPKKAGEGYPFDYLQNSTLHLGEPVRITHQTLDGSWIFVEAAQADGWVKTNAVAVIDKKSIEDIKSFQRLSVIKNDAPLVDMLGEVISTVNLGTTLSLLKEDDYFWYVQVPRRNLDGTVFFDTAMILKEQGVIQGQHYTSTNMSKLLNEIIGRPYGWGGLYFERDCSSTMRDVFSVFGLWLPRNSSKQRTSGEYIRTKDEQSLLTLLKSRGKPYQTLIDFKGHIGLYLGEHEGKPLIYHTLWGYKVYDGKKKGREIIGKSVITSLYAGAGLDIDNPNGLIDRVIGLTFINVK